MDFEKLALSVGWRDAVFQVLGLSFHLKYRLSGVLSINESAGRPVHGASKRRALIGMNPHNAGGPAKGRGI
jgi:hypothetical protein